MIESIIDYLNAKLALIGYFDKRYCLTEIKSEGENTFPVCYSANGDWQKIEIDQHDGVTYWRKSGDVSSSKVDNPFTTDVLYETTFPLRLVAFKRRGDVGADDNYTSDRLVDVIKKQITFVNETLKATLKARKVECIVTGSTTNSADVLADEFDPPFAPDVPFKWSAVAVEVDVMVVGTSDCMDACPTDTDILHGFDFCKQVVVDRLTPTQKTCLQNKICGDAEAATLDINGAPFATIPSGDTYDLDVVNSDDDAVGTSAAGDWVIADSTVRNNATPTWSDTVKAEATMTLAQAKMQDSDGSTVTADYIPQSQGFMFTATSCPPCADATVEVNGVSVGTVASGGTFYQLIQDDAGASVGTSANPSIVADCVVNNDASSPTWSQNIQPEQTFSLAQAKMLDSDGSTTVLADYKPNTDGFMFTASACTPCTSRAWVRNPDWLDMPTTSDGDNIIYILSAVRENQPNFMAMYATTSAANYTVDLYNDGTTVTNHASGAQSNFDLDYTKGTGEISKYAYKQVITKVTGNLTGWDMYRKPTGVSNYQNSNVLAVKITSQTITSLVNCFRGSNSRQYHRMLQEFEFFGTCNVTNLNHTFYDCDLLGKVTGNFENVTTASNTFFGISKGIEVNDMSMSSSGITTGLSMMSTSNVDFDSADVVDYFSGFTYLGSTFNGSLIEVFGTPDNPMQLSSLSSGSDMYRMFYNALNLVQGYFDEATTAPQSLQQAFRFSSGVKVISGIDGTNIANMTGAFQYCYSLQWLRISDLAVSFSIEDCNFSREGLVQIFNDLANASATITVTDNPGTGDLTAADLLIATNKGWTVTT